MASHFYKNKIFFLNEKSLNLKPGSHLYHSLIYLLLSQLLTSPDPPIKSTITSMVA